MAQERNEIGTPGPTETEEIKSEIERTRVEMSETLGEIQERLRPDNLIQQAKDTVTDAATGRPSRVVVSDTGIGIPADRVTAIFEPFQQLDGSADRAHGGTGLGLAIARRLCEAMGCRLTVESEVGHGSRFTVRLPLTDRSGPASG